MTAQKEKYRQFCSQEPSIPIFMRDWWLDAVCGEQNWDVCLVEKNGTIIAAMPYYKKSKWNFILLIQPPLTQFLGPWLRPFPKKYAKILADQKSLMQALIDQLPPFDYFSQKWQYTLNNWLPFFWNGFKQTTRYTYILHDLTDEQKVWAGFLENIRREIRKAEKRYRLRIREDLDINSFLPLNKMTFTRQGKKMPYSEELLMRLDRACLDRNCRKIFIAEDPLGQRHAGVYIVWDKNSAYYLMGGGNPNLRTSGATSLCMWQAIRYASKVTQKFDFEGSMLQQVERFFRAFGAIQTPYFHLTKINSKSLHFLYCIKSILTNHKV